LDRLPGSRLNWAPLRFNKKALLFLTNDQITSADMLAVLGVETGCTWILGLDDAKVLATRVSHY
jgi:hypothetical protein